MMKRQSSSRPISRKTRIEILLSTIQDEAYLDVALTACSLVDINKELLLAKIFTASFDESDTRSFQKKIASIAEGFFREDKNARLKSRPYTLNSENLSASQSTLLSEEDKETETLLHSENLSQSTLLSSDEDEPNAKRKCKRSLVISDNEECKETERLLQLPLLLDDDTDDEEELGDVEDDNEGRPEKPSPDHIWCDQCEVWKPTDSFSPEKQGLWMTRRHRKPGDEIFCLDHLTSHFINCLRAKLQEKVQDAPKKVQDAPKEIELVEVQDAPKKVQDAPKEIELVEVQDAPKKVQDAPKEIELVEVQDASKKNGLVSEKNGLVSEKNGLDVYSFGAGMTLHINGMAIGRYYRNYDAGVAKRYMDEFRRTHSFQRTDFLKMLPVGTDTTKFTEMELDRLRHFIIDMIVTTSK